MLGIGGVEIYSTVLGLFYFPNTAETHKPHHTGF
jgi:hypothetical protein